jgi:hypothetical protein
VVDDVDAELERHQDRWFVHQVPADQHSALMSGVDRSRQLVAGHLNPIFRRCRAVSTRDEELDDISTALDFFTYAKPERLCAIAQADSA